MLTGKVNIAVFAAFSCCDMCFLLSNAEFKPICRPWQLDICRYGWQKRQDRGKNGKVRGTVSSDSGTIWRIQGTSARHGWAGMTGIPHDMRLFKVRAPGVGTLLMELIYHRSGRLSSVRAEDCRGLLMRRPRRIRYQAAARSF
jgi:hypothetical protein